MRKSASILILTFVLITLMPATSLAEATDVQCLQEFARDMEECSELDTWWQRSLCGGDAEIELVGCIGREISPWR
jgi:hypothetical protein